MRLWAFKVKVSGGHATGSPGGGHAALSGWLFKLSGEVGAGLHRKWDRRFFKLALQPGGEGGSSGDSWSLAYFRDDEPDSAPSGTVDLAEVFEVRGAATERIPFTGFGGARGPAVGARFTVRTRAREYILGEVGQTYAKEGEEEKRRMMKTRRMMKKRGR